jgi:hypothetical protein
MTSVVPVPIVIIHERDVLVPQGGVVVGMAVFEEAEGGEGVGKV